MLHFFDWVRLHRKGLIWNGLKFALAMALLAVVLAQTSLSALADAFQQANLLFLIAAAVVFYVQVWILAQRYWRLVEKRIRFSEMLGTTIVQTSLTNLVATSVGAVAYLALLRGRHQMRLTLGVGSLVLARFGDLVVLTGLFAVLTVWLWPMLGFLQSIALSLLVLLCSLIGVIVLVIVFRERFVRVLAGLCRSMRFEQFALIQKMLGILSEIAGLETQFIRELMGFLVLYSFWLNSLSIVFVYCMARALSFPIDPPGLAFAIIATQLFSLVPLHVMGGLGTFELAMLSVFNQLGAPTSGSAVFLVSYRLVFWVFNVLMLAYIPVASFSPPMSSTKR